LETASKEYYRDICKRAAKSDKIGWFTEAIYRGQVIGSLFGFLTKTRFYFYQHGFLAQYSYLSIGNLLVYKTMLELINKKICTFYFLRGADSYKFNWTKTVDHEFFVMIGSSLIGKFALEWFRLQRSIRRNGRLRGIRYILSNKD
jgi:CelD/BcsL family acetyltransferase involved in cellulose biosynthesis